MTLYDKWIMALASNRYPKGKYALHTLQDQYCCLGVACDIYDPSLWVAQETSYSYDIGNHYTGRGTSFLPEPVRLELDLLTADGDFALSDLSDELRAEIRNKILCKHPTLTNRTYITLADLNDYADSFELIIKVLLERPPSLLGAEQTPY